MKNTKISFLKGLLQEWKKIIWPGRKDVAIRVATVIVIVAVLAVIIRFYDSGIQYLVKLAMNATIG